MELRMGLAKKNVPITRLPGVGKTTAVKKLADALKKNFHPAGFIRKKYR